VKPSGLTKNKDVSRRFRIASEVVGVVVAARGLVTEVRKGRRAHAGQAALKAAAALVGALIAIRAIEEVEDDE
jgi:hypothetical protein